MTTTIDPVSGFSVIPNRETGESTFASDADTWVSEMDSVTTTMNTSIGQINTAADEIEVNAALAQTAAEAAETSADYQGLWAGKTSAGTVGQSYSHLDYIWRLNVNVADLSTSEPAESNSDWSYANGPLRSDLEVKKPVGSFDESSMSALSIDGSSGLELRHSGEDLGSYTGFSFSVSGQDIVPTGIEIDIFGNFWVVGVIGDTVYKYNPDGSYANDSFSVAAQDIDPADISIDNFGNFWVVGFNSDTVYKYNPDGSYANDSFSVAAQETEPRGISIDSFGNFWVVGSNSDNVYKYNPDGSYANDSFSVAAQEIEPRGISIDSFGNFWVVGFNSDTVYKYNPDGSYANDSFSVAAQEIDAQGISIDNFGNFWVVGSNSDTVYKYTPPPSSTLASRFGDVDLGVMQIDSETNQAAMVEPLKVREPINDDEAASLNTTKTQATSISTTISDETIDTNGIKIVSSTLGQNGYIEYSDGRIQQWGYQSISTTLTAITFPLAFPNGVWNIKTQIVRAGDTGGVGNSTAISSESLTGFDLSTASADDGVYWEALGN